MQNNFTFTKLQGATAAVIYDHDTPETIMQKLLSARYLIDMRTDITDPLEDIIKRYNIDKKKQKEQQESEKPKERRFF